VRCVVCVDGRHGRHRKRCKFASRDRLTNERPTNSKRDRCPGNAPISPPHLLGTFYGVIFLHVPSRQDYQYDMCLYLNQILGYIGRSLLRPCCRGRKEEKVLADNKAEKSGYCRRSDFETPPTQATGVRPQPKWHGASEDAIMNVIRYQQERKAEGAFERPPYVKREGSIAESLGDQESCYCFFFKLFCYCIPV
jgi:hypothetical protein